MAQVNNIKDLYENEDLSLREISRQTGHSFKTVQKYAYQLGWMDLLMQWDKDEAAGKAVVTPCEGYKWNNLGGLYQSFYEKFSSYSLVELQSMFNEKVIAVVQWLEGFSEEEVFTPGSRKWASSTPSNWPVWKWVHINTVAPFKSFRSKIRKWKKLNGEF